MSTERNQFGGRFTNMTSQLQSDIYDAANSIAGDNVLIKYSKLEAILQQEIAKASIKEIETLLDEVMAGDLDDWNRDVEGNLEGYTKYRTSELSQTLKEHKEE